MNAKENKKTAGLRPDTLLGSVAILLLVNVVQRSVGFGRGVLFCRWLEPEQLGLWEMAYGFLLLASPVAVLGLPGSFGRYLPRFREQGQLRSFLRRTGLWTLLLAASAVGVIAWQSSAFASLVFGDASYARLMTVVAACLAVMISHHFLEAVFTGLRLFRVVSAMHFGQSLAFATIALTLILTWRADATSIVVGYAAACCLSIAGVLIWSLCRVQHEADSQPAPRGREFWPMLMRFAIWVWVTNVLANVFSTVDRYMILHYGGFDSETALEMVGNYHASIIVPVLLISVANLLAGAMTPHLSHDWEAGRRDRVSAQVNLTLKLAALGMLAVGCGVLLLCPLLFQFAFEGKYDAGLSVLPWTLGACIWYALTLISQTYIWCAEKTRSATLPLAVGIATNVSLNLLLLPLWGLLGAVVATGGATLLAFSAQLIINRRTGMRVHWGVPVLCLSPLLLVLGWMPAAAGLIVLGWLALSRDGLLTRDERYDIYDKATAAWSKISSRASGGTKVDASSSQAV